MTALTILGVLYMIGAYIALEVMFDVDGPFAGKHPVITLSIVFAWPLVVLGFILGAWLTRRRGGEEGGRG